MSTGIPQDRSHRQAVCNISATGSRHAPDFPLAIAYSRSITTRMDGGQSIEFGCTDNAIHVLTNGVNECLILPKRVTHVMQHAVHDLMPKCVRYLVVG
jgi:hypothetical protein